jgi:hypothetical protein
MEPDSDEQLGFEWEAMLDDMKDEKSGNQLVILLGKD